MNIKHKIWHHTMKTRFQLLNMFSCLHSQWFNNWKVMLQIRTTLDDSCPPTIFMNVLDDSAQVELHWVVVVRTLFHHFLLVRWGLNLFNHYCIITESCWTTTSNISLKFPWWWWHIIIIMVIRKQVVTKNYALEHIFERLILHLQNPCLIILSAKHKSLHLHAFLSM